MSRNDWCDISAGCLVAFCLAVLAGCGGEKQRQVPLEGTVTLDGKPLAEGSLRFLTASGKDGTIVCSATVSDGRFVIPAEKGPVPGKYRVEINASRKTGRKLPHPVMPSQTIDELTQYLPQCYNLQSGLTAEVAATGPNRFEFPLKSR
jgi:hypothetical protein